MKKTIFLFLIALLAVACQGPVGPEGPQGYGTNWKIINLTASASDWIQKTDKDGLNMYYTCHFSMPEINSTVYNDGSVITYIYLDGGQQPLPFVRHYQDKTGALWTETTDFNYTQGGLDVYITYSDFAAIAPPAMNFRVVLMW